MIQSCSDRTDCLCAKVSILVKAQEELEEIYSGKYTDGAGVADRKRELKLRMVQDIRHLVPIVPPLKLTNHDLVRLNPSQWFNDNVLDCYVGYIERRSLGESGDVGGGMGKQNGCYVAFCGAFSQMIQAGERGVEVTIRKGKVSA